jgi:hypothetical protein
MCSHYLVQPVACTPASSWEKGQVENQVGLMRERFFTPRLRFRNYEELNAWLLDRCVAYARTHRHVDQPERTIWEVFEEERGKLVEYRGSFDGFHTVPASVSKTCTVRFDNNKYSVLSTAVGRPVEIQAYADRIVIRQDGVVVAEHARSFGRGETIYDPWHYVPVLARKPGALRNGAPFHGWILPSAMERVRRRLKAADDGDRQMVAILAAVLGDGVAGGGGGGREGRGRIEVLMALVSSHGFTGQSYAILTFDARGHGQSGGLVDRVVLPVLHQQGQRDPGLRAAEPRPVPGAY